MPSSPIPIRRLLDRETAAALIRSFAPLLNGEQAVILAADGRPLAGEWPESWPSLSAPGSRAQIVARLAQSGSGEPLAIAEGALSLLPLRAGDQVLGALVASALSPALETFQRCLELLLAQNLEKHAVIDETLERYREINLLYYVSETVESSLDPDTILHLVLSEANRVIEAACGAVLRFHPDHPQRFEIKNSFGDEHITGHFPQILQERDSLPVSIENPDILTGLEGPDRSLSTILYAPLKVNNQLTGLIAVGRLVHQPAFTASNKKLLLALARQAQIALEKARVHQQELQRQRLEQELVISQRIQRSLLPTSLPEIPGWQFAASYQSASQVGGDLYDLFALPTPAGSENTGEYGVIIADVTGKGIPAALMMAFSRATLHAAAMLSSSPAENLRIANQLILHDSHSGLFLSIFYAILNPQTARLRFANGGHDIPFWYHAATGVCQEISGEHSLLLGAASQIDPREQEITLAPGDVLVLYTDGVTEARDPAGEFFAEEHLLDAILACARGSASEILQHILQEMRAFTHGVPQADDVTLLVIKRQ